MNREIGKLTNMVKDLTEKIYSSNKEESGHGDKTSSCSDMSARVSANPMPTPNKRQPRRNPHVIHDPHMDDDFSEIQNKRRTDGVVQPIILQTQVSL